MIMKITPKLRIPQVNFETRVFSFPFLDFIIDDEMKAFMDFGEESPKALSAENSNTFGFGQRDAQRESQSKKIVKMPSSSKVNQQNDEKDFTAFCDK